MTTRLTALATTHGVIDRVHYHTTVVRAAAQPAAAAGFTALLKSVVGISYHTYSGTAGKKHLTGLTRRQFDNRVVAFTRSQLSERTG